MVQNKEKHHGGKKLSLAIILAVLFTSIQALAANPQDSGLTPGQKEAWEKILFGGLGLILVMVVFFLFLHLRSRKRKDKNLS